MKKTSSVSLPIEHMIYIIRSQRVMLDSDLAYIYGVQTKRLNEQVRRNINRFPIEFMFQLTEKEWEFIKSQNSSLDLKSQNATSKAKESLKSQSATSKRGGRRTLPYVFTEHGAVMLASVLNSKQAIAASIQVVKVFVKLRELLLTHKQLAKKLEELESKYDGQFKEVFSILRELMNPKNKDKSIALKNIQKIKNEKK